MLTRAAPTRTSLSSPCSKVLPLMIARRWSGVPEIPPSFKSIVWGRAGTAGVLVAGFAFRYGRSDFGKNGSFPSCLFAGIVKTDSTEYEGAFETEPPVRADGFAGAEAALAAVPPGMATSNTTIPLSAEN